MRRVTLERVGAAVVYVVERDGETLTRARCNVNMPRQVAALAEAAGVDAATVYRWESALGRDRVTHEVEEVAEPTTGPVVVKLRGMKSPEAAAVAFPGLEAALACTVLPPDPVLSWSDDRLAALDVDFHDVPLDRRPTEAEFSRVLGRFTPAARWSWLTHGRGFRLIFEAVAPYSAAELAAVASLSIADLYPAASFEVKSETRFPPGRVVDNAAPLDLSPLSRVLSTVDTTTDAQRDEWLAERGLRRGERYPHASCPIAPSDRGHRDPVRVGDVGVYCNVCAAETGRGFVSYAKLLGSYSSTVVGQCARGLAHWEHVRIVVESLLSLRGEVARLCYSAALKVLHGDDERVAAAFTSGRNFVRVEGCWSTLEGQIYSKEYRSIVAELPACRAPTGRPNPATVERMLQPHDLRPLGYPAVVPLWGCRVWTEHLPPRDPYEPSYVVYPRSLRPDYAEALRPRYVPRSRREMTEADAWEVLEEVFPGLPRAYVELLICAKGCAEGRSGVPPQIFVTGPTGAGKTAASKIAAAICGDSTVDVVWTPNSERLRQLIGDAKGSGSFVVLNEALKEGAAAGRDSKGTLDFLLNTTEESASHKLYVGLRELGALPVFIVTDTAIPEDLATDAQHGRRLVHVPLRASVDWQKTLLSTGVGSPSNLRTSDLRRAVACNHVLSEVIDRNFRTPRGFDAIARRLGFSLLQDAHAEEVVAPLRDLFRAVCDAPTDATAQKRAGRGAKFIPDCGPLADAWSEFCGADFAVGKRRLESADLKKLFKADCYVVAELKQRGTRHTLRFVDEVGRVNAEIPMELEPVEAAVSRPRDAIDDRPVDRRVEAVFAGFDDPTT